MIWFLKLFIFMKNALFSIRYFYSYFCSPLFSSHRIKIPNIWGGRHKNAIFWQHKSLYPQKWKNVVTDKLWHMNGDYEIFEIDTLWFGGHICPFQILPTKWMTLNMWQKKCHLPMLFLFATKIEIPYKWWSLTSFLFT